MYYVLFAPIACFHIIYNALQLTLFRNNPYAAGEQHGYSYDEEKLGSFVGFRFHVGIVSSNKKHHKKSDKLRALLSYICHNVEVRLSCGL